MASKSGFEIGFLGPVLFFNHIFNMPIKLVDGSLQATTRGAILLERAPMQDSLGNVTRQRKGLAGD